MRLIERDLTTVYLKKRESTRNQYGEMEEGYSEIATPVRMNVQSAGGAVNAQIYGERLPYIKSCKYQGDVIKPSQNEMDGVCLYVNQDDEPDYEIKAIQPFRDHLNITLEKRVMTWT